MRTGLTHAEWSALTDVANQGTDEALIEVAERIIAARETQARAEALARQAAAVEALADEWRNKANGAILYRHARHSLLAALRGDA